MTDKDQAAVDFVAARIKKLLPELYEMALARYAERKQFRPSLLRLLAKKIEKHPVFFFDVIDPKRATLAARELVLIAENLEAAAETNTAAFRSELDAAANTRDRQLRDLVLLNALVLAKAYGDYDWTRNPASKRESAASIAAAAARKSGAKEMKDIEEQFITRVIYTNADKDDLNARLLECLAELGEKSE